MIETTGYIYKKLDTATVRPLITESEHAFVPSKKHPDETASQLFAHFSQDDPKFRVFGYQGADGQPVSYITTLSAGSDDAIAIGPMYVSEAVRGQGLGKRQVEAFLQHAAASGYRHVFTKTWSSNRASRAIFESLGFATQKVTEGNRANGDDTIAYSYNLQKQK